MDMEESPAQIMDNQPAQAEEDARDVWALCVAGGEGGVGGEHCGDERGEGRQGRDGEVSFDFCCFGGVCFVARGWVRVDGRDGLLK